jgi:hypothetical protein
MTLGYNGAQCMPPPAVRARFERACVAAAAGASLTFPISHILKRTP